MYIFFLRVLTSIYLVYIRGVSDLTIRVPIGVWE